MTEALPTLDHEGGDPLDTQTLGRITVLEALAEDTAAIGPSRSNVSTRVTGDPDDQ